MKSRLSNNSAFEEIVPALNNPALIDGTRTTLEKILSINLERIQPEDRFDRELDMDPKGDKGMLRFISLLEEKYDIDLPHCAACMKMTFGELVTLIDQKTQSLDNNDIPDTRKNSPTESHQHTGKAD